MKAKTKNIQVFSFSNRNTNIHIEIYAETLEDAIKKIDELIILELNDFRYDYDEDK